MNKTLSWQWCLILGLIAEELGIFTDFGNVVSGSFKILADILFIFALIAFVRERKTKKKQVKDSEKTETAVSQAQAIGNKKQLNLKRLRGVLVWTGLATFVLSLIVAGLVQKSVPCHAPYEFVNPIPKYCTNNLSWRIEYVIIPRIAVAGALLVLAGLLVSPLKRLSKYLTTED